MSRPQSKYVRVDATNPSGAGQCSRCGRWFNLRNLTWQHQWAGQHLYNTRVLVCTEGGCLDVPNEQLRTILLPPDPEPLLNARVPDYSYEEQTVLIMQFADVLQPQLPWAAGPQLIMCDQTGEQAFILQYLTQSAPGEAPPPGTDFFVVGQSDLGGGDSLVGARMVNSNPTAFKTGKSKAGGEDELG